VVLNTAGNTVTVADTHVTFLNTGLPRFLDSNGTHYYQFAVSNIAADRTVTLPLLTASDDFVFAAHTQTLSNKTFSDSVSIGTGTLATTGTGLRFGGTALTTRIAWHNGTSDYALLTTETGANAAIFGNQSQGCGFHGSSVTIFAASGSTFIYGGSAVGITVSGTLVSYSRPRVGNSTAYASEGRATQAMADANQTLAAATYSRRIIRFTGAITAQRTATFPHPASEDASYEKIVVADHTGAFSIRVSTGTGTTFDLSTGARAVLAFTPDGVQSIAT
jgi:hypothetical protein